MAAMNDSRHLKIQVSIAGVPGADIRELASYAEFGLPSYETGGFTSPYGFTGELQDAGTGVVAFGSRSYDAGSGIWMAPDAWPGLLVQPQSLNRYAYVLGDPVTFVDVGGFKPATPVLDKKTVLNPSALLNHYTPNGGPGTWNSTNAYGDRALTSIGQTVTTGTSRSSPNTVSQTILQDRHANTVRVCTSLSAKASCGPTGLPGVMSRMQSGNYPDTFGGGWGELVSRGIDSFDQNKNPLSQTYGWSVCLLYACGGLVTDQATGRSVLQLGAGIGLGFATGASLSTQRIDQSGIALTCSAVVLSIQGGISSDPLITYGYSVGFEPALGANGRVSVQLKISCAFMGYIPLG